jgi:hypothetical protein
LERNGVDAGIRDLPKRVQYAVRQCGGLFQFNQRLQIRYGDDENPSLADNRSPIFLQKDFIGAYKAFTVHQAMVPELTEKGLLALPPKVRAFLGVRQETKAAAMCSRCGTSLSPDSPNASDATSMPAYRPKSIPQPLTDAQLRERREMLRQQTEFLKGRSPNEYAKALFQSRALQTISK